MKILIAGSNGFVGKNFVNRLSTSTHQVLPVSRSICDLSNPSSLSIVCEDFKPDLLIHSAVSLQSTENNLSMYYSLENASKFCGKCIMIGSGAEYSHQRYIPLMNESYFNPHIPPQNKDPYHISKFTISRIHENSDFHNIFNFRVFGLYGKHEDYTRRLISNNILTFLKTGKMFYNKNISFDYLYIDDLLDAILCFSSASKVRHRTYNVCAGKSYKFSSILEECIESLGGTASDIECKDNTPSTYDYSGDCTRFENEFNYKISKTSFSTATKELTAWLQSINPSSL